jgi:hypothetical protein
MSGAVAPHSNMPSWRGPQLRKNTGTNLPLSLLRFIIPNTRKLNGIRFLLEQIVTNHFTVPDATVNKIKKKGDLLEGQQWMSTSICHLLERITTAGS